MKTTFVSNSRVLLSAVLLLAVLPMAVAAQGFDKRSFATFVDMRVGTGQPIYWYCIGTVYAYPSGAWKASTRRDAGAIRLRRTS